MPLLYDIAAAQTAQAAVNVCDTAFNFLRVTCGGTNISSFIFAVLRWILGVSAGTGVFVLTCAGCVLVWSAVEPDKIAEVKKLIIYVVVGLIVIIFAFVITSFIRDLFYGLV